MQRHDEVAVLMRMRKVDSLVRDFLNHSHETVVVHIGCGLDTRFQRVAQEDDRVDWFDLDVPPVIELRRKLLSSEDGRNHMLAVSAFEEQWLAELEPYKPRPFLFVAEGVLPYFEEDQVRSLFVRLRERFPGAELVTDAHTPFVIWADNLHLALAGVEARLHWALKNPREVENWADGICLLEEWNYYDDQDPRLKAFNWVRWIPPLAKSSGIYHYRLG
jgi:O-methyltransferase involved in polyketide biosynthesis